ncbi:MAG: UDP-N-acetylmuramate dehydrogenase [Terriglobales bacterium]
MTIQENVALAPLTTLKVGGAARYFAEARNEDDAREAVRFAKTRGLPLFVLGGGSNLVIADAGWPGLVLKVAIGGIATPKQNNGSNAVLFSVGAGVNWDDFVAIAVSQNCAGVECLSGIPGSVGGTPVQNVGAYGQEVAETIESVRALDTKSDMKPDIKPDIKEDRVVTLPKPACGFRYRSSIFNRAAGSEGGGEPGRYIILQVNYRLKRGGAASVKYADLQKHFADAASTPSLAEVRNAVREIRRSKGMLIVPGDEDARSVGSFFKNPVLSESQFRELAVRADARGLTIPSYPALEAQHKVSAAWLVEHSGFEKGFRMGRAAISSKHALALINPGSASGNAPGEARAADIIELKDAIQQGVESAWGIRLIPEPVLVGF